jgi:NTP pyrophosphatase (non-canonical NTP hydrolase)
MFRFRLFRAKPAPRDPSTALTFEHLRQANLRRSEVGFGQPIDAFDPSDRFLEVLGELGEAANAYKKIVRTKKGGARGNKGATIEELRAKLRLELGDTLVTLDLVCQGLGICLEEAAIDSFNSKSREIGYDGFL